MNKPAFEWNKRTASDNKRNHGVIFEEARSAFLDDNARVIPELEHSDDEARFVLLDLSVQLRLPVVVHCRREEDDVIRTISARKAGLSERKQYSDFLR